LVGPDGDVYWARLATDAAVSVESEADGSAATVRVSVTPRSDTGSLPPVASALSIAYAFHFRADDRRIGLEATLTRARDDGFSWREVQIFHLHYLGAQFDRFAVSDPYVEGSFAQSENVTHGTHWGLVERNGAFLALYGSDVFVYDGSSWGSYIHGPWLVDWRSVSEHFEAVAVVDAY
jgi:hypothetical protein